MYILFYRNSTQNTQQSASSCLILGVENDYYLKLRMGNALFSKRIEDSLTNENPKAEKRIFPQHMYGGPLKLGDPFYRGMSHMELDPMIPQR